jgi:hypothetical protein
VEEAARADRNRFDWETDPNMLRWDCRDRDADSGVASDHAGIAVTVGWTLGSRRLGAGCNYDLKKALTIQCFALVGLEHGVVGFRRSDFVLGCVRVG